MYNIPYMSVFYVVFFSKFEKLEIIYYSYYYERGGRTQGVGQPHQRCVKQAG
jgi:hypothetical protein